MNQQPVQERTLRVIAIASAGFAALLLALPEWATAGVAAFGAIYAALVYVLDENVRNWIPDHRRNSGVRDDSDGRRGVRDDAKKVAVKSPASRRAAT